MMQQLVALLRRISEILTDRLLLLLLLGVIVAAFFFAFVLKADTSIVFGIVTIGVATALIESAHHRNRK